MQVDFTELRKRLGLAARQFFDSVRAEHSNDRFYSFALCTHDGANCVWAAANSEEAYKQAAAQRVADESKTKWLDSHGISLKACLLGDYRWSAFEWQYASVDPDEFSSVDELINNRGVGVYDENDPSGFENFKVCVFASMVLALSDLDADGYFGVGAARESVTLFCSVADSDCGGWLEKDSARRLNSPEVFEKFNEERIRWIAVAPETDPSDPDSLYGPYLSFLP